MKITNLNKSFGKNIIFDNFNISFEEGKINYIMGKSGIGKTTLLRIISGLDTQFSGEIDLTGKISYVFQEPRLFPTITVLENIKIVNEFSTTDPRTLLDELELTGCDNMFPEELSGGMKMRLSLARAIYYDPDIIIMDEPFASIDKETKDKIAEKVFKRLKNKTVIIVSHDENDAQKFADNIINL